MALTGSGSKRRGRELEPITDAGTVIGAASLLAGTPAQRVRDLLRSDLFAACVFHPRGVAGVAVVLGVSTRTIRRLLREPVTRRSRLKHAAAFRLSEYLTNHVYAER